MSKHTPEPWELKSHSHQIADTGDYDGHYEITNGKISILTKDDDDNDDALQQIVDALNNSGCKFYLDDAIGVENQILRYDIELYRAEIARLREALRELYRCAIFTNEEVGIYPANVEQTPEVIAHNEMSKRLTNAIIKASEALKGGTHE